MRLILFLLPLIATAQIQLQPTAQWNSPLRVTPQNSAYNVQSSDLVGNTELTCNSNCTYTLPQAGTAGFEAAKWFIASNVGSGTLTINTTTSNFYGGATSGTSMSLSGGKSAQIVSNGTNWLVNVGSGGGGGSGTVTNTGTLSSGAIMTGNGGVDSKTPNTTSTLDSSGNMALAGKLTAGGACVGCAGSVDLPVGTDPGATPSAVSIIGPPSLPSAYRWSMPTADAAGAIVSDGAGTPGQLSIVPFSGSGNIVKQQKATLQQPVIENKTVAQIAALASPLSGEAVYATDGSTTTDCTTGGGSNKVLCIYNGSVWAGVGGGGGGSVTPATPGVWQPWPFWDNNSGPGGGNLPAPPGIVVQKFSVTYPINLRKLGLYINSAGGDSAAWAIYSISGGTATLVTGQTTGTAFTCTPCFGSISLASTATLNPGDYYAAWSASDGSFGVKTSPALGCSIYNIVSPKTCAFSASGGATWSGSTVTWPSTITISSLTEVDSLVIGSLGN